ncbi:MAG: nickel-dependent hydrogenase large subunit [Desulfuromonadaceae bacterium]|nr:nickel-dependent hydrogenase large subunit [Desulfuromonadaceae bacterium]MDD2854527.1 nickel-dependent hydrogenase large subunit [Desulfuromonadaceae bacterium]
MSRVSKVDILARVEGHGTVELVSDGKRVVDARFLIHESPRFFEALLTGRRFDEVADIACRICSICSTVHKIAALQAVEQAMGIYISRQTALLRELALYGGVIESHALHIFCLALPDYLDVKSINELSEREPQKMKTGLKIKKLGNFIQESVGGRAIHPFNLLLGGVGTPPTPEVLKEISDQIRIMRSEISETIVYALKLEEILPPLSPLEQCAVIGSYQFSAGKLMTSTGRVISADYGVEWFNEHIEPYSNAKISRFDGSTPLFVGPLARILLSMPPLYSENFVDRSIRSSLKARAVELELSLEKAEVLIRQLIEAGLKSEQPAVSRSCTTEGVSLIEAPRGTLLHRYRFDTNGICRAADIITPTAINQSAIAASLKELIVLMDGADYDQIKKTAEILIRCYDPCISCAVH